MRTLLVALVLALPAVAQEGWELHDCGLEPPGALPLPPVPVKPWEPLITRETPPLVQRVRDVPRVGGVPAAGVRGQGALAGKVIYLSPGHGFTWTSAVANWRTQRGNTNDIVEDLVSIETLSQYLMPMLLNAGARVVPVRELDLNPNLVIVDNGEAGYVESGTGFSNSTLAGWGRPMLPMTGATLPFALGTNRLMSAAATPTASATYTATIPQSGYYEVSVSYTAFSARVPDAHYVVRHAGGETHFRVNQQRHGGTWVHLGRFYFHQGGTAQVVVQNDSSVPGGNISLDAVKFGGGMGLVDRGAGVSGRPRFEECSRYHTQFSGAPSSVWAPSSNTPDADRNNDISARPRFAAWVHEPGEDAIYVAWHTNAFNATATGTETYVYGPNPPDGTLNFTGVAGSLELAQRVHAELIADIKSPAGWNRPTWTDRRVKSAYFGELNPSNNNETPAILIEVAFHDAAADAAHLVEPNFRYLAARAIAQGIIKYWAARDSVPVRLPPEPPTHVSAVMQPSGEVRLSWRESPTDTAGVRGDSATGYRVYSSVDGLGWDNGVDVTGTSVTLAMPVGAARFFRITGTNAGGESFPSATVGARATPAGQPRVLVVNGYERVEAAIGLRETFAAQYSLGTVTRIFLARMNDGSYARVYGDALAANGVGFDSADWEAVAAGDVAMGPYDLLAWFAGRGKQGGAAPGSAEQDVIKAFRMQNRPVFFSGNAAADGVFLSDVFQASAPGPTGGLSVTGADALAGLSGLALDDGSSGAYATGAPPTLAPAGANVVLASYSGGATAAVGTPRQTVVFGFPFETLVQRSQRHEVMRRVLMFLGPAGFDGGAGPFDAGVEPEDAGVPAPDAGLTEPDAGMDAPDAGLVEPDAGVTRQPVLAFQGGGCSAAPAGLLFAAALAVLARRARRR
jgi:N-acetylmuramoyl-L-alanine amidase